MAFHPFYLNKKWGSVKDFALTGLIFTSKNEVKKNMTKPLVSYAAGKDCISLDNFCEDKEPREE